MGWRDKKERALSISSESALLLLERDKIASLLRDALESSSDMDTLRLSIFAVVALLDGVGGESAINK